MKEPEPLHPTTTVGAFVGGFVVNLFGVAGITGFNVARYWLPPGGDHTAGDLPVGHGPKQRLDEVGCDRRKRFLSVIDINAKLAIAIEVENYEQVVKNDKGRFLGTIEGSSSGKRFADLLT